MSRINISSGSAFEAQIGYSRAVVTGDYIHVSGTTGYDYEKGTISPDVLEQTEQALRNIEAALAQAGGASLSDVVRVRYILPDRGDFPAAWPALRRCFDDVRPAATMVQAGLMDEAMKIEIEVTAWKPGGDQGAREAGSG